MVALEGYDCGKTICEPRYMLAIKGLPDPLMPNVAPVAIFFRDAGVPIEYGEMAGWPEPRSAAPHCGSGVCRLTRELSS
jgi:hypothetical protein